MNVRVLAAAIAALIGSTLASPALHAQVGTISAEPESVIVPPGVGQTGSSVISWNASGVTQAVVTVDCLIDFGEQHWETTGTGPHSRTANFPNGEQCEYKLRADSVGGTILDSVIVTTQTPQFPIGTLSANPAFVTRPASEPACWTTLQWTTSNNPQNVDIIRDCNGESVTPGSNLNPNGSQSFEVPPDRVCDFRLYTSAYGYPNGFQTFFLDETTVECQTEIVATISANPSRVNIHGDVQLGETTLTWTSSQNNLEIRRTCTAAPPAIVAQGLPSSGSQAVPVPIAQDCTYSLRTTGSQSATLAETAIVQGVELPPPNNACPPMCDHDVPDSQHDYGCTINRPEDELHFNYQWSTVNGWHILSAEGPRAYFRCNVPGGDDCSTFGVNIQVTDKADGSLICQGSRSFTNSGSGGGPRSK